MTLNKLLEKINKRYYVIRRKHWVSTVAVIADGRVYQGYFNCDEKIVYVPQFGRATESEDFTFTVEDLLADNWQAVDGCTIADKALLGF